MKGLWQALAIVCAVLLGFAWGDGAGFRAGERRAEERFETNRTEHNAIMRKLGTCSWAKVMAAQIECQHEFKPGEP